jgi:hypothetical protein
LPNDRDIREAIVDKFNATPDKVVAESLSDPGQHNAPIGINLDQAQGEQLIQGHVIEIRRRSLRSELDERFTLSG